MLAHQDEAPTAEGHVHSPSNTVAPTGRFAAAAEDAEDDKTTGDSPKKQRGWTRQLITDASPTHFHNPHNQPDANPPLTPTREIISHNRSALEDTFTPL